MDLRILLDTCILVYLVRDGIDGKLLERRYSLSDRRGKLFISSISLGEILAFAKRSRWHGDKCRRLYQLLDDLNILSAGNEIVPEMYAELKVESEKSGFNTGQNDLWIAATAMVSGSVLLTADADFRWMTEKHLDVIFFDRDKN